MQELFNRFKDPLPLILAAFTAIGLLGAWNYAETTPGLDYYVAWVAADAVKNDNKNDIYDPISGFRLPVQYRNKADEAKDAPRLKEIAAHKKDMSFTATPFLYWVTAIFAIGDYEADLTTWHALSISMMLMFFIVACRLLGYSAATTLAILLPVVAWFIPFQSDLRVGNVNNVQLGMIGIVMWLLSRSNQSKYLFAASVIVGLTVMFKPNLAPIGLMLAGGWLLRHHYSRLVTGVSGMLTGVVTAVLVSSWWLGKSSAWLDWFKMLSGAVGSAPGRGGNYSVMRQLSGGLSPAGQLLLALLLVALALAFFWWGRRRQPAFSTGAESGSANRQSLEDMLLVAMGCVIALMASSLVWIHYYLLTIPLMLVLLRPWEAGEQGGMTRILMQRVIPAVALVLLMDSVLPVLLDMEGGEFRAIVSGIYLLMIFAAGMWQLAYGLGTTTSRS